MHVVALTEGVNSRHRQAHFGCKGLVQSLFRASSLRTIWSAARLSDCCRASRLTRESCTLFSHPGVGWCSPLTPRFSIGRTSRSARYRKIKFDTIDNDRYWQIVLREHGRGVCLCSQRAQPSNRPHAASRATPPLDGDGATRAQRFAGLYPLLRIFQALRLLTRLVGIL